MARNSSQVRSIRIIRNVRTVKTALTLRQGLIATDVHDARTARKTADFMAANMFANGYDGLARSIVRSARVGKSYRKLALTRQEKLVLDVCAAHGATVASAVAFLEAKAQRRA